MAIIRSRAARNTAIAAGGLFLLLAFAMWWLQTDWAREAALERLRQGLRAQNILLERGRLDYDLFGLRAGLSDVVLRASDAPAALPPIATIERAEVVLNWHAISTLSLDVDSASLTGAKVQVAIDAEGRTNVPNPPKSTGPRADFLIRSLLARDASLVVDDRQHDVRVTLEPWTLKMTGSPVTRNHAIQVATSKTSEVIYQGRTLPVETLSLRGTLEKNAFAVEHFVLASGESRVEAAGRLENFDTPDGRVTSTLDLGPLAQFAGRTERVGGLVKVTATAQGALDKLKAAGELTGENLEFEEFAGVNLTAKATYDGEAKRAKLSESTIQSPYGTVNATADVALEKGDSTASARVDRVAIEKFLKGEVKPASQVSVTAKADWPAMEVERATFSGLLRATPTQSDASLNRLPLAAEIALSGRLDQLKAEIRSVKALGTEASGTVYVANRQKLSGTLTAGADQLAEVARQMNLFQATKLTGLDGRMAVAATIGGTVKSPTVEAAVTGEELRVNQVQGAALNVGVTYAKQVVTASGLEARWQGQKLLGEGSVNLDTKALQASARTENVRIETLLASLGADVVATGAVVAEVQAAGTTDAPTAHVEVTGTGVTAYSEPLGRVEAKADFAENLLRVTELRVPAKTLQASGTYQVKTEAYTVELNAPKVELTKLQVPQAVRGTLALSAKGAGTVANPQLEAKVDGTAITVDGAPYGDLSLTAAVRDHQGDLTAAAPKYQATATAQVGVDAPYATTFTLKADGTRLSELPLPEGLPLEGALKATLEGKGEIERWEKGTASLTLEPVGLKWNQQAVMTDGPILAEFANETLAVKQARVVTGASHLAIEGSLPLDPKSTAGSLKVTGEVDLAEAPKYVPEWEQPVGASGKLTLDAEVRGNLKRIEPTATLALKDGTIVPKGVNPISDLQLAAQVKDGTVVLERLSGTWAKAQLTASGEFPLGLLPTGLPVEFPRKQGAAKLTADAKGLDIASIEGVPANTSGTVSAHLEAEAPKAEITALTARATIDEMRLKVGDVILEQSGTSSVTVANGLARIEKVTLTGPGTDLALRGRAQLTGDYQLGVRLAGNIETGVLSTLMAPARMRGPARIQLSAYGPAKDLKAAGFVELTDAQIQLTEPRIAADAVNARIDLTGDQLTIARLDGQLNGGTLTGKGGLKFSGSDLKDINLALEAKSVYLDYPGGLRTLSDANLTVKQTGPAIVVGGAVNVQEGSFRELVTIEGNLLSMLNSQPADDLFPEERNRYLEQTQFNVAVKTESPLLINNNLAKAGLNLDVRLAGNYYRPALLGRVTFEEGGELYFNERSYAIERGNVTFTNDQKIEPTFDILARTKVSNTDITLLIAGGGAERISTTLTSDPPMDEQSILAMLITGKSPEDYKNTDTATLAGRQALSYFAGSFGSRFTRQLEKATGISTVRVEPDLIANESNPTARLTIGQDLSPAARLIYSMNLANGGDQIYVAEYDITRRFTTRGIKQIDNTYRFEFRHDLRFGGIPAPKRSSSTVNKRTIGKVDMPSGGPIPEQKLRDKFKNKPGKKYDFFEVRKGMDRLEKLHRDENLLEARVRVQRDVKDATVDLALQIEPGPRVAFAYEGWDPSRKVRNQVRDIWRDGVFDAQRVDDATRAMQTALIGEGYLEAKIEPKVTSTDRKLVTFDVQPGVKFGKPSLEFPGASGVKESELRKVLNRRELKVAPYLDAAKVRTVLQAYYRERGFLDAQIQAPRPVLERETGKATVQIPVSEGTRYQVASVQFTGNTALDPEKLQESSELRVDTPYELPLRQISIDRIRDLYTSAGFHDAQVEAKVERRDGKVDVTYRVTEGPKEVVEKVEVEGNDATSEKLVRSQIGLKPGQALEPGKLAEARRNLYSTGAYSLVDLERLPVGDVNTAGIRPMVLRAKLREVQPFEVRYGAYYDTDRGPGAVIDFTNRNSLGSARAIGGRLRYDSDFREARVFFSQPLLQRFPVQSIVSSFVNRTLLPTFITDRIGASAQQEMRFKKLYLVNYGYRMERVHTFEKVPDEFLPFDVRLVVAPLTFTMNRESRDDVLDATRGSFISNAFEWAPEALGSDVRFIRYFGQFFKYHALSKPSEIPWSGGVKKPRLVYAGAARVGLARGLGGQDVTLSERFFAGGGTTLRGFAQNTLGPKDFLGDPAGGNAVLLINNELRFPLFGIFDGVGFSDIGNVYTKVSDLSFGDIRKVAGAGLRIRTPYFLIRLDYGFKLDRKPGESIGGFFFSIGQAF